MLRFNILFYAIIMLSLWISIHLMLRFNLDTKAPTESMPNFNTSYVTVQLVPKLVPICPLYNFNTSYVTVQQWYQNHDKNHTIISIHLMLRFNLYDLRRLYGIIWFQYILCYGSTLRRFVMTNFLENFNTSYVTVQLNQKSKILLLSTISIHLMLRFNQDSRSIRKQL